MTVAPLAPKTSAPVHRPGLVRRSALLEQLARTSLQPLVLLVAPPGYGKTTVLAQWAEDDARDVAWMTVEEADNDPARILYRLWLTVQGLDRSRPSDVPAAAGVITVARLAEKIRRRNTPVLIVLDDLHHLHRAPVPDVLIELAMRLPHGSQLAVASRSMPPLKLGRLRAEGRCAEFGPTHLAFNVVEAAEALALAGVDIDAAAARRLFEHSEGWPAGIYLAALARRERFDLPAAPGEVSGDDAHIADFFREELLSRQSPETVRFLLRTAVLGQLSAPLCDAVLDATDSASRLDDIERQNLFLVPLDHRREWYRYHRLFAEALMAELRRREPDEEQRVNARAAAWYERRGEVEEAIEHWITAGEPIPAGRLVARHGQSFVTAGRIATVVRWLTALGPEVVESYPPLSVSAAWVCALTGDADRAHALLRAADSAEFTGPMPDGHTSLRSAVAGLRANLGTLGVDRMLDDARLAVELEPPGSPWHPVAALALGTAQLLSGNPEDGAKHLEQSALLGRRVARSAAQLALAQLSLLSTDQHDDNAADRYAASAYEVMTEANLQEAMTAVLTYLAAAKAHLRAGRRQQARHQVGIATRLYLRLPPTAFPCYATQIALVLGEVSLQIDDLSAARTRVMDARQHLSRLLTEGVLRERLDALSATVAGTGRRRTGPSAMALTAAEERALRLLPTHLSLGEISDELYISRSTVKSQVAAVYRKLHATTRTEAVNRARELGLLSD